MTEDSKLEFWKEKLAGTRTEQNLHTALSAESQAYLRYKWFESQAKKDGYEAIAQLFARTAENEKEHAEIWFRHLGGWSTTERNLNVAADGEHFEWATMYDEFAATAREEGMESIAELFGRVADIEREHEKNYRTEMTALQNGTVFASDSEKTRWICLNCGHIAEGKQPPSVCPVCSHPQGWFQRTDQ